VRKSAEWETELATVTAELSAFERPATSFVATGERIIEVAKRAGILYKTQDPAEQRRVLDSVLSNCTFDRGSVCPTYKKPFDLFVRGNETGEWRGRRDSNPSCPSSPSRPSCPLLLRRRFETFVGRAVLPAPNLPHHLHQR
jgi:hypothetical protein